MKSTKALLGGLALTGSLAVSMAAGAAENVSVGVSAGGIAFGYNDGYWDRGHNWHDWKNKDEVDHFRAENKEHYYDRKHDEDKDKGWHDADRWWDRH